VRKNVLVIIPAFSEEDSIAAVINGIKKEAPFADIVVVNDGSRDATGARAAKTGVPVLDLPFNLGIGGAMQTGFKYARDHGYEAAIQVDADGQHDPRSIKEVVSPVLQGTADLVVGSRHIEDRGYKASVYRGFGMKVFSRLISMILGQKITDTTSGFRAGNKRAIRYFADYYPTDYPEVEALVLCHYAGLKILEVPVHMRDRDTGRSSITPRRAVYYMTKVSLATLIWMIRRKPSLAGGDDGVV
jgi:glycosyltransferase involved in cell wall biosynthesis